MEGVKKTQYQHYMVQKGKHTTVQNQHRDKSQ